MGPVFFGLVGGDISFFQMLWAFRPSSKEPLSLSLFFTIYPLQLVTPQLPHNLSSFRANNTNNHTHLKNTITSPSKHHHITTTVSSNPTPANNIKSYPIKASVVTITLTIKIK
jgi:hypothetical protein